MSRQIKKRVILAGKAGSGKDFLRDYMVKEFGLSPDISVTTRPPRKGEVPGVTYKYITDTYYEQLRAENKLFEAVRFNGWGYGTLTHSWENSDVFIMTPSGVSQIPKEERKECFIVYLNIPQSVRKIRLQKRSDADSVDRRIAADEKDFLDFLDFDMTFSDPLFNAHKVSEIILSHINHVELEQF